MTGYVYGEGVFEKAKPSFWPPISHIVQPNKWDKRFMDLAQLVSGWSEDTSRGIGAVIVGQDNEVRSLGFNGFPRMVKNTPERNSREGGEKYKWFEHAERNAIFNAARVGIPLKGCKLYGTLYPCADCARGIIQSGIIQVNSYKYDENDRFAESFKVSLQMFFEAGIEVRLFDNATVA